MRKRHYRKLRALQTENGDNQSKLAVITGRSQSYCDERMSGQRDWTIGDSYAILDYYDVPYDRLHEYFPKGGI